MTSKPKKLRPVKAWVVYCPNGTPSYDKILTYDFQVPTEQLLINRWPGCKYGNKKHEIIPVLITPILPKSKRGTNKPRTKK